MLQKRKEIRQTNYTFELEACAVFNGPDHQSFQTTNHRQADFHPVATFKHLIVIDHETMRRHVDDMDRLVAMKFAFRDNLVVRTMASRAAEIHVVIRCRLRHSLRPLF